MSKRIEFKEDENEWCSVTIELRDRNGKGTELSICGSYGRIETREDAEEEALRYWLDFFEDDSEFGAFVKRFPQVSTPKEAAQLVLDCDGEFHGLDVHKEDGERVYLLIGCGQCREEIRKWFPEVKPYLPYHLNNMKAGCEHQRATGYDFEISDVCAVCGYKYGHEWKHLDLPAEIIEWAEGN